jgi:methionyl-tRNA formyltransferase
MKFIIMTDAGPDNNFVQELITSKLLPALIVTNNPFYCGEKAPFRFLLKKGLLILRYFVKRSLIKRKYQAYFLAKKYSIPLWLSEKVNNDAFARLIKKMEIDYAFVFTFGIIKENIYNAPKSGCINFHPSLLPLNRGASPSNWIILKNQLKTGITFHFITKDIDAGPIIEQYEIPVSGYETAKILNEYLFNLGTILFVKLILRLDHSYIYNLIQNDIQVGSYEPPFAVENIIISDKNTFQEINSIIRASRIHQSYALYKFSGKEFRVINCVDLTGCDSPGKEYPSFDYKNNIYLRSSDNTIVLLVTKKKTPGNVISRFIRTLTDRSIYRVSILFLPLFGKLCWQYV